jgi:hypothetical protein
MGMLDDAIREHLELKRRTGADDDEVTRLENEAFGAARREPPAIAEPEAAAPPPPPAVDAPEPIVPEPEPAAFEPAPEPAAFEPAPAPAPAAREPEPVADEPWLEDEPEAPEIPAAGDTAEFTAHEAREAAGGGAGPSDYVAPDDEGEDLLEETPDFLQETPEHDRLWFEQKPPRDFDV